VEFIHSFPHPLGGGNTEGFEAGNPFYYKDLTLFSSDSVSTSTTKLLIYSTFFKA
jgi:hypothetical protein